MEARLGGHVEPNRLDGKVIRDQWRLVVELPSHGRRCQTRLVSVAGKRRTEAQLGAFIAELERELYAPAA